MKPILQHANRKSSISITIDVNKIEYSNIASIVEKRNVIMV